MVLATRGSKEVHETAGGSGRDYITVLGAGSVMACGCLLISSTKEYTSMHDGQMEGLRGQGMG